jgi:protein TonB
LTRIVDWLKDVFVNDDIVSAVSGKALEPPFFDRERKRKTQLSTIVGYFFLLVGLIAFSLVAPKPEVLQTKIDLPDLIYVMAPGPGGGGGGNDDTSEQPASELKIAGEDTSQVAVNLEVPEDELVFDDPDKPEIEEEPEEEEVVEEEDAPAVVAPVVAQAPDDVDQKGTIDGRNTAVASMGPDGSGTGMGSGHGSGIGEGFGGGTGGGYYRMGSGITSPVVLHSVQPNFTDDALARKIQGEVIVEIVILKDGSVRPVRVLRSLSADLDQRALEAASQWKFIPGKLQGEPVDVIAEIAVSFNIL